MTVLDVNNMDQIIYLDQLKNEKQSVELKCQSWRPRQKLITSTYSGQIAKCQKFFENIWAMIWLHKFIRYSVEVSSPKYNEGP